MIRGLLKKILHTSIAFIFLAISISAGAQMAKADDANPLQLWTGPNGSFFKANFEGYYGAWGQSNSWFGYSKQEIGADSRFWQEALIKPGVTWNYGCLPDNESIYGRATFSVAATWGGVDAGGTNVQFVNGAPKGVNIADTQLQDTFIGWKSGDLFNSWGLANNFLDLSFGRQSYKEGSGFLFWNEGRVGYDNAAYWMGMRTDADWAGIARLRQGPLSVDLIYLKANDFLVPNMYNFGLPSLNQAQGYSDTTVGGGTFDYNFPDKVASIGGGVYNDDTQYPRLPAVESMMIYDAHGWVKPFAIACVPYLAPLKVEGEFANEQKTHDPTGNGWYAAISYPFADVPLCPELSYRYTSFSSAYDTLFYGFGDWEYWFQGEIMGEYVKGNHNLNTHMVELKFKPLSPLDCKLAYIHYDTETLNGGTGSKNLADELDFVTDWTVNKYLSFSLVGAMANPNGGMTSFLGLANGTQLHTWYYGMLLGSIHFY